MNVRHLLSLEARMSESGKSTWMQHNCHFKELKAERCNLVRNLQMWRSLWYISTSFFEKKQQQNNKKKNTAD